MTYLKFAVVAVTALTAISISSAAQAATFDFETLPPGDVGGVVVLPEGTFTSANSLFNLSSFYFPGAGGSICAFDAAAFNCQVDMVLDFSSAVTGLMFESVGFNGGDFSTISAYDGATFLGSISGFADALLDFSSFGSITQLVFDDSSTGAGYGYGAFKFDQGLPEVPVPAALPLLLTALGGLGIMTRRRAKSAK